MALQSIGELAQASGVAVANIRYYEQIGLLPRAQRSAGGQRAFPPAALDRLAFIRSRRALGFSIAQVADLLRHAGPGVAVCTDASAAAQVQLAAVRRQIADLRRIETELEQQIIACAETCGDGTSARCALVPVAEVPRLR